LELELEKLRNQLAEATLTKKVESTPAPVSEQEDTSNAAAEETEEGVVSSNALSDDVADVDLPHNSNSLTE
jgi:regulator of replication initiation timing